MINNSKKEEILLSSFNVLKDNLGQNIREISEIIAKISKINFDLAIEMWKFILIEGESYLRIDGYPYTSGILYKLLEKHNEKKVIDVLLKNNDIFEKCFFESSDIYHFIIHDMLTIGEISLADRAIEAIYNNNNKEESFTYYLIEICEYFDGTYKDLSDYDPSWGDQNEHDARTRNALEGSQVLMKWIGKISDQEKKSILMVSMVDYV